MQVHFDTFVTNLHSMFEFKPSVLAAPVEESRSQQDQWQKVSARIAHDLKEPIRNLSSCAKLLADLNEGTGVGLDQATLCGWLRESADRAQDMIEAILKLSLQGKNEPKTDDRVQREWRIRQDARSHRGGIDGWVGQRRKLFCNCRLHASIGCHDG